MLSNLKNNSIMRCFNIFKIAVALSLVTSIFSSCQDEIVLIDDLKGQSSSGMQSFAEPTIIGVYEYSDFMNNEEPTPSVEVQMGEDLVISGENLQGVTSLTFHGLTIDAADFYAEWSKIIFRVPRKLPAKDAANNVEFETKFGKANYTVDVVIPDIVISNVTNEFALPGSRTYINGDYLTLCEFDSGVSKIYIEKEATNGESAYKEPVEITLVSEESVTVVVPDDAPNNAYFTFEINGEMLTQKVHYRPIDKLLFDGTNPENTCNWTEYAYTDGTQEGDLENLISEPVGDNTELVKYIRVFGNIPQYKFLYTINYDIDFELEDGKTSSDYCLAYEINTKVGSPIQTGNTYKLMVNNTAVNMWEDYSKVEIDTNGEWVTQRVSFTEVAKYLKGGEELERFDIKNMAAMTDADHAFANFRIEPIIN